MALEKQLDELMGYLAQALTATYAMNADKLVSERDEKLKLAITALRTFGEELKTLGKAEAYFQLQDAVLALARSLRAGVPQPYADLQLECPSAPSHY